MSDAINDQSLFANMYIEKVLGELIELTKIRLMNETRIAYLEKVNADLLVQTQTQIQEEVKKNKVKLNKRHTEVDIFEESSATQSIKGKAIWQTQ